MKGPPPVRDSKVQGKWFRRQESAPAETVLLYVYGGTFGLNHGPSHERIARRLSETAKSDVLLATYSLSPEKPFPLAVDDVAGTYCGLLADGWVPSDIVVVADTAGASIAFGALLALRDEGETMPAGAVALFPWVDLTMSGGAYIDHIIDDGNISDTELLAMFLSDYLQGADPRDPLASPALADLKGLPVLQIHAKVDDILADDARLLADAAKRAGVPVQLHYWHDVPSTLQRDEPFPVRFDALLSTIGDFARRCVSQARKRRDGHKERLTSDYLSLAAANIQPHMEKRIEEMFAWAKDHGPDWVWAFIEKRLDHGAVLTQEQIEHDWLAALFSDGPVPTLLLTASRYVLHANRAAYHELDAGGILARRSGRLVGASVALDKMLSEILRVPFRLSTSSSARPDEAVVRGRLAAEGGQALLLRGVRMDLADTDAIAPPVMMVRLIRDPAPVPEIDTLDLRVWFGLSPKEAELAAAFAGGVALADYARHANVSMATVRSQFAQIKSKLQAADQAAVVRKVLSAATLGA